MSDHKGNAKLECSRPEPGIAEDTSYVPLSSSLADKLINASEPENLHPTAVFTDAKNSEKSTSIAATSSKNESTRKAQKNHSKSDDPRGNNKPTMVKKQECSSLEKDLIKKATQKKNKRKYSKSDSEGESGDDGKRKRMEQMERKIDSLTSTVSMLAQMFQANFTTPNKEQTSSSIPPTTTTTTTLACSSTDSSSFLITSLPAASELHSFQENTTNVVTPLSSSVSREPQATTNPQHLIPLQAQAVRCSTSTSATFDASLPSTSLENRLASEPKDTFGDVRTSTDPTDLLFGLSPQPPLNRVEFCSGLKAGENFPERIKNKIWEDKYVDFFFLLHPDNDATYNLNISVSSTQNPALSLLPKKPRVLTEREWNSAFDEYIAVYCRKFPELLYDLLTYGKFVKNLMAKGHNWVYYDSKFRRDREHSKCPWTVIRVDLKIEAAQFTEVRKTPFRNQRYPTKNENEKIPFGYCFYFHSKNQRCDRANCKYKHECTLCSKRHPNYLCPGQSFNTTTATINKQNPPFNQNPSQSTFTNPNTGGRLVIPSKRLL